MNNFDRGKLPMECSGPFCWASITITWKIQGRALRVEEHREVKEQHATRALQNWVEENVTNKILSYSYNIVSGALSPQGKEGVM